MFYVFLVGLAKLHCGATPPSVMVLFMTKVCPNELNFVFVELRNAVFVLYILIGELDCRICACEKEKVLR